MTSFLILLTLTILAVKFLTSHNSYEKILSFYFIFTNITLLILLNSTANFEAVLDIAIILFLLQLVAVLFLLSNCKKT